MSHEGLYVDAVDLLRVIWRAVDADFKSRYARETWRIYEDRVRSAANQNASLARFANQLVQRMVASLGRNEEDRATSLRVLQSGNDRALLKLFRDETAYLIALVRVRIQGERDAYHVEETE